jgi:hypothetical protein
MKQAFEGSSPGETDGGHALVFFAVVSHKAALVAEQKAKICSRRCDCLLLHPAQAGKSFLFRCRVFTYFFFARDALL